MPITNCARITIALAAVVSGVIVLATGGTVNINLAKAVASASTVVIPVPARVRQVAVALTRDPSAARPANHPRQLGVLYYVFRSDKHALEPDTNPPARGAADLTVATKPSPHLDGDYWM